MPRAGLLATLLVASAVGSASAQEAPRPPATAATGIWTAAARERMVRDALKVAPPALLRIVRRHPETLMEGLQRGTEFEGQPHHRQDAGTPGRGSAAALATVGRRAVDALDGHLPMRELVYYLGLAAHFASDLSDPILTDPAGRSFSFAADYALYVERNLGRFPVVFYGYPEVPEAGAGPPSAESLEAEGHAAAAGARRYFAHLDRAYLRSAGSSSSFDVRSIPFGVASLCYSRAVTNIARAWLHIWRAARGDLTGTPYLGSAGRPAESPTGEEDRISSRPAASEEVAPVP